MNSQTPSYIRLQQEFVYLAVLMDVFSRSIRGWHLSRRIDQNLTITALRRGLEKGIPEIHHSDQGVQYAATDYVNLLKEYGAKSAWQKSVKPGRTAMLSD